MNGYTWANGTNSSCLVLKSADVYIRLYKETHPGYSRVITIETPGDHSVGNPPKYLFRGSDRVYKMDYNQGTNSGTKTWPIRKTNDHAVTATLNNWICADDQSVRDYSGSNLSEGSLFINNIIGEFEVGDAIEAYLGNGIWDHKGVVTSLPTAWFSDVTGCTGGVFKNMNTNCTQQWLYAGPPPYSNTQLNGYSIIATGGTAEVKDYIPACYDVENDRIEMVHASEKYYACFNKSDKKIKINLPI